MRVIIAGSRTVTDYETVVKAVKESGFEITTILCGCANGVDLLGKQYGIANSIPVVDYPAQWTVLVDDPKNPGKKISRFNRLAGFQRNSVMVEDADALIAVWDGMSRGTKDTIDKSKVKGLKVFVYNCFKSL